MAEKKPVSIYDDDHHRITHLMAWAAMFISIIALALVGNLYWDQRELEKNANQNNSTVKATNQAQEEQDDKIADLTTDFKLVDMRARVTEIRDDIEAGVTTDDTQQRIGEVRTSFRTFYAATESIAQSSYQEIDQLLLQLSSQVGSGSAEVQTTVSELLTALQQEIERQTN